MLHLTAGLTTLLIASEPNIRVPNADDPPRAPIQAATLRRACMAIWDNKHAGAAALRGFCETESNPQGLFADNALRADLDKISEIASKYTDAEWLVRARASHDDEPSFAGPAGFGAGALNESAIVWGIAEFIANRARVQVNTFAMSRTVSQLCGETGKQLAPESCTLLRNGISDVLRTPGLLHVAARRDMTNVPSAAVDLYLKEKHKELKDRLDLAISARLALGAILTSARSRPAEEAFAALATGLPTINKDFRLTVEETPIATGAYLVGVTLLSMGSDLSVTTQSFDRKERIADYTRKALVANLALGRPRPSPTRAGKEIWQCDPNPSAIKCPYDATTSVVRLAGETTRKLAAIRAKLNVARTREERLALLAEYGSEFLTAFNGFLSEEALLPTVSIPPAVHDVLEQVTAALAASNYQQLFMQLVALPDAIGVDIRLPQQVFRVASLAAALADADSASTVSRTLETFAGGSRSYAEKRRWESGPFLTLNAYGGAAAGWEDVAGGASGSQFVSAYAPIGLELGVPLPVNFLWLFRSVSLYVQAIDVGALSSWRLKSTTSVDQEPEVKFSQVVSPAASLLLGFRGVPLSVGVGAGVTPRLRKVTQAGVTEDRAAIRWPMITLGMDIPLFP